MGNELNILFGGIEYKDHVADDEFAKRAKPNEVETMLKASVTLKHNKGIGHDVTVKIEQGFVKTGTFNPVLVINSISYFRVEPYDDKYFKKPASNSLISMIADIVQSAADHNRGMFVVIREDYDMDKDACPKPYPLHKLKAMIFNDVNQQLLN